MKKIMKKALSLVLVLALALVPITVFASDEVGTQSNAYVIEDGSATVTVPAGQNYYFYYLAPSVGEYTLTADIDADVSYFLVGIMEGTNPFYSSKY